MAWLNVHRFSRLLRCQLTHVGQPASTNAEATTVICHEALAPHVPDNEIRQKNKGDGPAPQRAHRPVFSPVVTCLPRSVSTPFTMTRTSSMVSFNAASVRMVLADTDRSSCSKCA